jgi:hypothetical protein
MDWEKRTTQRAPLQDAAAEAAAGGKSASQMLLSSLQASEAVRKERYLGTVTAKMKEARAKLPSLEVKHSPMGEAAVAREPTAEVNGLLFDQELKKVSNGAVARWHAGTCAVAQAG